MSRTASPEPGEWLGLAAAPTFAVMAIGTMIAGGAGAALCGAGQAWPLGGMAPMYVLMGAFHAGPWLKRMRRPMTRGEH